MKHMVIFLLAVTTAFIAAATEPSLPAHADSPTTCVYLQDSGHNLHGAFLAFYLLHNGTDSFGLPLTEAFIEDGFIVQYFERGRLELHVENTEPFRVLLGLLGLQYNITDPPMKPAAVAGALNNPAFRYFPDTGLMIGLTVKDYFDSHGGIDVFGYPVSMLRFESGNFAQYFQRARLEWSISDSEPSKVRASPVGQLWLDQRYPPDFVWRARAVNDWCPVYTAASLPPGLVPFTPPPAAAPTLVPAKTALSLQVRVRFHQTGPTGPQYVDVSVTDQNNRPFAGAALYATVKFPNGDRVFPMFASDGQGKSSFSFDIGRQPSGTTTFVEVSAFASGVPPAMGRDSFTR
ncbi:MAG: hypothetical protein KGJ80_07420 [Chloroflexota bacterium]|nr:hypothetical protein [Chloroflexota bacterium]